MKNLRQFLDAKGRMNMPGADARDDYDDKTKADYLKRGLIGEEKAASPPPAKPDKPKAKPKATKPVAPDETKPDEPTETK